ncbi:MAG: hypothetical protein V4538_01685 [Bacteroidota bacterium]
MINHRNTQHHFINRKGKFVKNWAVIKAHYCNPVKQHISLGWHKPKIVYYKCSRKAFEQIVTWTVQHPLIQVNSIRGCSDIPWPDVEEEPYPVPTHVHINMGGGAVATFSKTPGTDTLNIVKGLIQAAKEHLANNII